MRNIKKYSVLVFSLLGFLLFGGVAASASILGVQQGGTASSTLSGILVGNGISPVGTLNITTSGSSGASTYSNGTLNIPQYTGGGASFGYPFPSNATTTNITFTNGLTGALTGNADTATKLSTGRTLSITGDLGYTSPSFDGSGNVTAAGTLATVNGNVGSFTNANITVNAKGLITAASNGTGGSGTGLSTTSPISAGNLLEYSSAGAGSAFGIATSSIGAGTGLSFSGTAGAQVGGTNGTYSVNTTQNITTLSNLSTAGTVNNTSGGVLYSTATTSISVGSPLTVTGTLGALIGGTNSTINCQAASGSQAGCLSSTDWNTFNGKQAAGNYITALTGDVTASGPGSSATTLATVNTNVGSFTNANITVNGKGLITAASNGTGGGSSFGQTLEVDASKWLSATTTNSYGINANTSGTTYGFGIGDKLLGYASTTNADTIFGVGAGGQNATTSNTQKFITALGYLALSANTTGSANTATGYHSLFSNTAGGGNTANGVEALFTNISGNSNTAVGQSAAFSTTGSQNTAVGNGALQNNTTGTNNTAVGYSAAGAGTLAYQNTTAVGAFANWNASAALLDTTELGYEAGYNNTGWNSTFLGELSGQNVTSANNDILVGYNALAPSATLSNQLNIGNLIFGTLPATTSATTFSLLTGGNIGIGTSTPWKTLSVGNANVGSFAISTSTSGCATFSPFGEVYSTGTACGSGGGGTFSTTTSQVSGELINHPNNNTDVVVVGASATTSAPFYIDPNSTKGPFFSVGSSSPFASFSIHGNPTDGSIQTTLFAIGSSTATATTTLFSINNTGNITTSMTGTQCVHEINGLLSGTGSDCGSGGSGRTTTASWPIAFSDCSPETTSTRFAIGGSFFAPMAVVNTTSFTPMVMTFGYATSSAMDCIVHLPTDYSANLTFNAIFTSTTTAAGIVPLDLEATSTANGSQYGNPNAFSQIWPASTTAADRIKLPTVAGVGTSTAISLTGVANLSAGQDILIRLTRWGANAADTMGGDLYLPKMWLTYTSQ